MNLLYRILAALVGAAVLAGAVVMGAVVATALLAIGLVAALGLTARVWWLRRKLRRNAPPSTVIDAEYTVVEDDPKRLR